MKNSRLISAFLLFFLIFLTGCSAIAGIFKAGVWVGVLGVGAVVLLIIFLLTRGSK